MYGMASTGEMTKQTSGCIPWSEQEQVTMSNTMESREHQMKPAEGRFDARKNNF